MANVIEVLLRTKADNSGLNRFKASLNGLKAAIGGIGLAAGFAALARNIEEAEKATAQLDAAYKNTGRTVGRTRQQLDDLATQIQKTTTVSDDLVKEAQAILLTFDRVRGEAFERTVRVAADLSARLGTDLKGSIRQVGLALQDPERGLILLRRAGVAFTDSQKATIKGFLETNQAAKAQNLILGELERRFGGSAAAARNTLGGALTGLKNAFGDLFEGTRESTQGTVNAVNDLSAALADPRIKTGIDTLITGFSKLVTILIEAASLLGGVQSKLLELAKTKSPTASAFRGIIASAHPLLAPLAFAAEGAANQPRDRRSSPYGGRGLRGQSIDGAGGPIQVLDEINITVRKIADKNADALRELEESTRTSVERVSAEYSRLKATLQTLLDEGLITKEQYNQRIGAGITEVLGLEEIDLNEIKAKYITLKRATSELGEFMKGVWQQVGRSIQSTISDTLYEWRISWKSFIDIARRALADIGAAILTSGIKKALQGQLSSSSSGGGFLKFVGGLFGLAGGGNYDGIRKVGEDGPELVSGRGRVWNSRQMAFAGMGGAKINYAPTFNLSITSSGDDDRDRRLAEYVDTRISQSQTEFVRTLDRSGVAVSG